MTAPIGHFRISDGSPNNEQNFTPPTSSPSTSANSEDQEVSESRLRTLTVRGSYHAESWRFVDGGEWGPALERRRRYASKLIGSVSDELRERQAIRENLEPDEVWLLENARLLQTRSQEISHALKSLQGRAVLGTGDVVVPRAYAVAMSFLQAVDLMFTEQTFSVYLAGIQQVESLCVADLGSETHAGTRPPGADSLPSQGL